MAEPVVAGSALRVYQEHVKRELYAQEKQLQELKDYAARLEGAQNVVKELPTRLRHQIAVPFGRRAFFLGHLVHTNELVVHLGASLQAEATADHAAALLGRRIEGVKASIISGERHLSSHRSRIDLAGSVLQPDAAGSVKDGAEMEIRQSYEESEELLSAAHQGVQAGVKPSKASVPSPEDDQEMARLFARMDELEAMEAAAEAAEQGTEGQEHQASDSAAQVPRHPTPPLMSSLSTAVQAQWEADSDDEVDDLLAATFTPVHPSSISISRSQPGTGPLAAHTKPVSRPPPAPRTGPEAQGGSSVLQGPGEGSGEPFKKGFLLHRASAAAPPHSGIKSVASTVSAAAATSPGPGAAPPTGPAPAAAGASPKEKAFTGQVIERPGPSQSHAAPQAGSLLGQGPASGSSVAMPRNAQETSGTGQEKKVSRFRQQRQSERSL